MRAPFSVAQILRENCRRRRTRMDRRKRAPRSGGRGRRARRLHRTALARHGRDCRSRPPPDDVRRRNTVSAAVSAFRLASGSPARPSSPMPTMVSQGSIMMRALILGGTSDANRLAEAAAQLGLDAIYSYARPHPGPGGAVAADPHRRIRRRQRPGRLYPAARDHACGRCHASVCGRDEPQRGRGLRDGGNRADRT